MKRNIFPVVLMLATVLIFASCMGHDSNDDYSYYGDAAITEFSLGTVNQYLIGVRKSTGVKDSLYKQTYTGSSYVFYIDQNNGLIYNPEPLPYGTDAAHILATITSKNSGTILLKDLESDEFDYYSSSDSIDFSQDRLFRVVSQNGENIKDYTVKVSVQQQDEDEFKWTEKGTDANIAQAANIRLAAAGEQVYAVMQNNALTETWVYDLKSSLAGSDAPVYKFGPDAYKSIAVQDGKLYLTDAGKLYVFEGGQQIQEQTIDSQVKQLVGACSQRLYALSVSGSLLASKDQGTTWTEETLADDASLFPTTDINLSSRILKTNTDMEEVMLMGNISGSDYATVWTQTNLLSEEATAAWSYVDLSGDYRFAAPKMSGLTVLPYNGKHLAFGVTAENEYKLLLSHDGGITWKENTQYAYPESFDTGAGVFSATVDDNNYIWLADHTGQVWCGYQK